MLVLYGLGILIALVVGRGKEKARRAETEKAG
jgi:Sec-independent protein secretion pathway component TatC